MNSSDTSLQSLGAVTEFMKNAGVLLSQNPQLSFLLPKVQEELKTISGLQVSWAAPVSDIYEFVMEKWRKFTSVNSTTLPHQTQLELVKLLGEFLIEVSSSLSSEKIDLEIKKESERKISTIIDREREKENFRSIRRRPGAEKQLDAIESPHKKILLESIMNSKHIREHTSARFLYRTGYRSHFFFDFNSMIKDPRISNMMLKALIESITSVVEKSQQPPVLVWVAAEEGEYQGYHSVRGPITDALKLVSIDVHRPNSETPDPKRAKRSETVGNSPLIQMDDVSISGWSLSRNNAWCTQVLGRQPDYAYALIIGSGRLLTRLNKSTQIISEFTRKDWATLIYWKPEIINMTIESELWPALDLRIDFLEEICLYADRPDLPGHLNAKIESILREFYPSEEMTEECCNVMTNILLLCWNYVHLKAYGQSWSRVRHPEVVIYALVRYLELGDLNKQIADICFGNLVQVLTEVRKKFRLPLPEALHLALGLERKRIKSGLKDIPALEPSKIQEIVMDTISEAVADSYVRNIVESWKVLDEKLQDGTEDERQFSVNLYGDSKRQEEMRRRHYGDLAARYMIVEPDTYGKLWE